MDEYFDLGSHSWSVSTDSPAAQTWFDRGLVWAYAFHREEAVRCFERVVELDPTCAMGHWGLAYVTGPYYNGPWKRIPLTYRPWVLQRSHELVQEAQRRAEASGSDLERALVAALAVRIPEPVCNDQETFDRWDSDYADAMRHVWSRFGDDDDVCALTVDALICRTPWQLWNLEDRVPAAGADTAEALDILNAALDRAEREGRAPHPGLLHFDVHIMEMAPEPERALASADTLRSLVPDAAHLVHMPSHLYVLCGQFDKSLEANVEAVAADDKYVALHPELGLYTIYRLHNLHFQIYSAMFLGQYEAAVAAADRIWETVTEEALRHDNTFLVNYLETFYGMKVHVLIRFGRWQEIIDAPMPVDADLFLVTTALWHYAKGVAYAATGDIERAREQQSLFTQACERVPSERIIFNNESRAMLRVGDAMLAGELEYRQENYEVAFAHLQRCVELYDHLNYSEPWVWMQPPRHALGALLLEQGRVEDAAAVYRADLGIDDTLVRPSQHPGNLWSLHGYLECCQRLGRDEEAADIAGQLAVAVQRADIDVTSSCFCRQPDSCCD